ncbi:MAG TPA: GGDEF domain-containing protein [Acidimicrobiales bacterium]
MGRLEAHEDSLIAQLMAALGRVSPTRMTLTCLALLAVVAVGDFVTGEDVSFSAFYLVPVFLASTNASASLGVRMAGVVATAWFVADITSRSTPYESALVPVWNASVRFLVFWLVVALVAALRRSAAAERALSRLDALSGLMNARAFYEQAEAERRRAVRYRTPTTVAYLDIDDFKQVNDELGHAAGDDVLAATAEVLTESLRDVDIVARLGGDEFALVLPGTDEAASAVALDRVHGALRTLAADRRWPVGFSIGAVTFDAAPRSVDDMIGRADAVMYEVKKSGKNGVRRARAAAQVTATVTTPVTAPVGDSGR